MMGDSGHGKKDEKAEKAEKPGKERAIEMAKAFLLSGLRVMESDSGELVGAVQRIIDDEREGIGRAVKGFMSGADTDSFLTSLLPAHYRILYEAYAPYWLSHCHPVSDHDDDAEFTYYNDIIDMYWAWKWQEWKKKGEWCVTVMLPPTAGLVRYQYREEMEYLKRMHS